MIEVRIYTPEGSFAIIPNVKKIEVDTTDGQRGILPGHMSIVLMLEIGTLVVETNEHLIYTIAGGMLYFEHDVATILSDAVEDVKKLDMDRAEKAKQRAQKRLADKDPDLDIKRATLALNKALNRLKVGHKYQ